LCALIAYTLQALVFHALVRVVFTPDFAWVAPAQRERVVNPFGVLIRESQCFAEVAAVDRV